MDHREDNTQFENLLPVGGSVCGGVVEVGGGADIVGVNFGKLEEHGGDLNIIDDDDDDDGELKYRKEVQQSEKQLNSNVAAQQDVVGNSNNVPYYNNFHHQFDNVGNGNGGINIGNISSGLDYDGDLDIIRTDGDFSTTSNTTSTPGEVEVDFLKVEMKIEEQHSHDNNNDDQEQKRQTEQQQKQQLQQQETEEDEPSSLATNTTSSLSENVPSVPKQQQNDDKENLDPHDAPTRPTDFDTELHSQLNPDAAVFVPSFGSNTASPTSPTAAFSDISALPNTITTPTSANGMIEPHLNAVPQRLLGDNDDFLAESPCKGRGTNMDDITLPAEDEFEHEAAKRPHELEQEGDLIGDGALQLQNLPHDEIQVAKNLSFNVSDEIGLDLQEQQHQLLPTTDAEVNIDHGPETSVDLDNDFEPIEKSNEKSIDLFNVGDAPVPIDPNNEIAPIEDILNTVQPLPTDDDISDQQQQQRESTSLVGEKELLNFEEKEYISQSPSTEELQFNAHNNALNTNNDDDLQIPTIDMDTAGHMEDSFYIENTSSATLQQQEQQKNYDDIDEKKPQLSATDDSLLIDTTFPSTAGGDISMVSDNSIENVAVHSATTTEEFNVDNAIIMGDVAVAAKPSDNDVEIAQPQEQLQQIPTDIQTVGYDYGGGDGEGDNANLMMSPNTAFEKHLLEDTKELQQNIMSSVINNNDGGDFSALDELQSKMGDMFVTQDGNLPQVDDYVANIATTTIAHENEDPAINEHQLFNQELDNLHLQQPQELIKNELSPSPIEAAEARLEAEINAFFEDEATTPQKVITTDVEQAPTNEIVKTEDAAAADVKTDDAVGAAIDIPVESIVEVTDEKPTTDNGNNLETAAVVATATAAAAAAVTAVAASTATTAKKSTKTISSTKSGSAGATTAKSKIGDSKLDAKKPIASATTKTSTTSTAATAIGSRPRTAPAKIEKKSTAGSDVTKPTAASSTIRKTTATTTKTGASSATTTAKRPLTASSVAGTKATTKPTTSRVTGTTSTTTVTQRHITSTTATAAAAPKPKPAATTTATKPTTLGITATTKPKLSPRSTLTSQLRKTGTGTSGTVKSPNKPGSLLNGNATKTTVTTTATGTNGGSNKTVTSTTTTTTKTFTARPAPKTTTSATTTTRRVATSNLTVGNGASKTSNTTTARKISPLKPSTTGNGATHTTTGAAGSKLSPAFKAKTKDSTTTANKLKSATSPEVLKQKQQAMKNSGGPIAITRPKSLQKNGTIENENENKNKNDIDTTTTLASTNNDQISSLSSSEQQPQQNGNHPETPISLTDEEQQQQTPEVALIDA